MGSPKGFYKDTLSVSGLGFRVQGLVHLEVWVQGFWALGFWVQGSGLGFWFQLSGYFGLWGFESLACCLNRSVHSDHATDKLTKAVA